MAIDTAAKRRSAAGIPFWIGLGVTPNAGKDAAWRQQAGWGYSGIAAGGAPAGPDDEVPFLIGATTAVLGACHAVMGATRGVG